MRMSGLGGRRVWVRGLLALLLLTAAVTVRVPVAMAGATVVTTTTVSDTVYHADGTVATGTLLVSWPAFTTGAGQGVAGGSTSAVIGPNGVFSIALAPNVGATPAGTFYTAVYHLDDGTTSSETWQVPVSTSTMTLAAVRSTVVPSSVAVQVASKAYVNSAVAAALAGQPVTGTVTFLERTGDTMVGPLTLAGDPTTSAQAANKHYVDTALAAVSTGLSGKLGMVPSASQVVVQPAGTQMQVNELNSVGYASQFASGAGGNGLANALGGTGCASGCQVIVEQGYTPAEQTVPALWPATAANGTHVQDLRGGGRKDVFFNPVDQTGARFNAGQTIDVTSTQTPTALQQATSTSNPNSAVLALYHEGLAGGSNLYPQAIQGTRTPYFKSNFNTLSVNGSFNTLGQHVLMPGAINCYAVGDCLIGAQFITASGGFRDEADEGTHPMDLQIQEDKQVFRGTCATGCATGSTSMTVAVTSAPGTQGEGRFLLDMTAAKTITSGVLTGGTPAAGLIGPSATFSGTNFARSVFLQTAQLAGSQKGNMAPGTVTLPIQTVGLAGVFATTTAALPASSGVACVVEGPVVTAAQNPPNYETAPYTVVDATHVMLTLNKPHAAGATVAVGGLCGYGLEQTVDTANGVRQVFPVIGSASGTSLYYAGGLTQIVGTSGLTSSFLNVSLPISSVVRANGVVTVTTGTAMPSDVNGLTLTVAGVADGSFNGSFAVTTTGANSLTFAQSGANGSSSGGTIGVVTGGYVLYPMAEVLGVLNGVTGRVDGAMTLAPNTVAWSAGDTVEEPHYFQENVSADLEYVGETTPRSPNPDRAGIQYQINVGPGMHGWSIENVAPVTSYLGNGGTHAAPDDAYESLGVWNRVLEAQAGERSVFTLHCNSHGCAKWNSGYHLFEMDSSAGQDTVSYQPQASTMTFSLRGGSFAFSPTGLTAPSISATTLSGALDAGNVATGTLSAARLPVFGASGSAHAVGAVPDPGATAGATRYLREDGSWATPATGSGTTGGGASGTASITGGTIQNAAITGGTMDGATIGGQTPAAGSFSVLKVTGCNWFLSGANQGIGTCAPTSWNAVSGVDGNNLQVAATGPARLILTSSGTNAAMAEFHFINMGAPSNSRNWRMSNNTSGQYTLDMNSDSYTTHTIAMQCGPGGACNFPNGLTASNFNGVLAGTTGSVGGAALAAGSCASGSVAVSGATVGVPVAVSASDGSLPSGLTMLSAAVTSAGTVTVQVCAVSAVTPRAVAYNVRVLQ